MAQIAQAIRLAWRDWKFEGLMSFCSVLALASMLMPIMVLQGLKNGVIEGMRSHLLEDPEVLLITPKSDAGRFTKEDLERLAALPGARHAVGRVSDIASDLTLANPANGRTAVLALEPAAPGDPVLEKRGIPAPEWGLEPGVVLSQPAAAALGASVGGELTANLSRSTPERRAETAKLTLHVLAVLPIEAASRRLAFLSLRALEDIQDFRDNIAVPARGFSGGERGGPRSYSSFRLYAKSLDDVEGLARALAEKKIESVTKAREIAGIRLLESAINQIIAIISLAMGAGFVAFIVSSVQSSVTRKKKMLGLLRLLGFMRLPLTLYPIIQTLLTAASGFLLSLGAYFCVSLAIKKAFAAQGALSCSLTPMDCLAIAGAALALSLLACLGAAIRAGRVEPSIVIREV